jgi:hypothetical protein
LAQLIPSGTEFQVNTYTTDLQRRPAVASQGSGEFVVVWQSYGQDGSDNGVFGHRFNSVGDPLGTEFQVNSFTPGSQRRPVTASHTDGSFVVVWRSYGQDGSDQGIFGQRFDEAGVASGTEFQINTYTTGSQRRAAVASAGEGNFVVVWESYGQDSAYSASVFARQFNGSGAPIGPEFRVNVYSTGEQRRAAVAGNNDGSFVVVWQSYGQDGSDNGVFGRRFDSTGASLGPEFQVNSYTTYSQRRPAVASHDDGSFVVAWRSYSQDGSDQGIFAQRFGAVGVPTGSEFRANTYTTGGQRRAAVATAGDGSFVVLWQDDARDGSSYGIFARQFDSSGASVGSEFLVNTYTTARQRRASVTRNSSAGFVVVWQSDPTTPSFSACATNADCMLTEFCVNMQCQFAACSSNADCAVAEERCIDSQCRVPGQDGDAAGIFGQRLEPRLPCGDASGDGKVTATDAFITLAAGVGLGSCQVCICDVDDSGAVVATDALSVLAFAVGQPLTLNCSAC